MSVPALVADILELAAIPAPTFAEEARIAWLEERMREAPGERVRDAAGNLVWRWGEGRPELAVLAHVDTVFAAETPLAVAPGTSCVVPVAAVQRTAAASYV